MSRPTIIGIAGPARSGKDEVTRILWRDHGFWQLRFAGPVKDMLMAGFGLTRDEVDGASKDEIHPRLGVSVRRLMQTLGTDWGRKMIGEDLWIKRLDANVQLLRRAGHKPIVITDVRYENEADYVRRHGGAIWHVHRKVPANVVRLHDSEAGIAMLPGTDSFIDNSAGLEQLADQVKRAIAGELVLTDTTTAPA